ncbi:MAG: tripartite tricarboxylate transporter substrate binding protein [Pseudomonadota bacterium]
MAARELARGLEPVLGRNVLVVNRVGGNGVVQLAAVKASNPDGHTLAINTTSHLALFATVARGQHQRTDFAWVARLQLDPFVVYAQASSPLKSLRDFVDLARRRASDGKPIPVGGSLAAGGAHHIAFSMLAKSAGFDFAWIPFQGGDHVTSVLGGHLDAGHANPGTIEPLVRAGKLRVIGVFSDRRLPDFPDAPTYAETGFKADTRWMQTRGIFMHRDTPVAVQNALAAAIRTVTRTDAWRSYLANSNQIDGFQGPADYTAFVAVQERITLEWLTSLGLL